MNSVPLIPDIPEDHFGQDNQILRQNPCCPIGRQFRCIHHGQKVLFNKSNSLFNLNFS